MRAINLKKTSCSAVFVSMLILGACGDESDAVDDAAATSVPSELGLTAAPDLESIGSEDFTVAADDTDATSDNATTEAGPDGENSSADDEAQDDEEGTAVASTPEVEDIGDLDREIDDTFVPPAIEDDENIEFPVTPEPGDPGRLFGDGLTLDDIEVDVTFWFEENGVTATPAAIIDVPLGSIVGIRTVSYSPDTVSVEGYDLRTLVDPGDLAIILFRADQAGSFDVRLDNAGIDLGRLVVS